MATWGFSFVVESLPLMPQATLIHLGCALSKYLFTNDKVVAAVIRPGPRCLPENVRGTAATNQGHHLTCE